MTISSWAPTAQGAAGAEIVAAAPARLRAEPLDASGFAPFGSVLETGSATTVPVNEGRGRRMDMPRLDPEGRWSARRPAAGGPELRDTVALYALEPSLLPVRVALVERHPLTPQLFWPLEAGRWVVVVMPSGADGEPDAGAARAFLAAPGQALVYAPGTWHLPLAVLDRPARFLMRMAESGTADDCHERVLASPFDVAV